MTKALHLSRFPSCIFVSFVVYGLLLKFVRFYGDPGGSRTPNPQIRSLMLYPVELRGRAMRLHWIATLEGIVPSLAFAGKGAESLGWETGIEPATVGATVRCSTS